MKHLKSLNILPLYFNNPSNYITIGKGSFITIEGEKINYPFLNGKLNNVLLSDLVADETDGCIKSTWANYIIDMIKLKININKTEFQNSLNKDTKTKLQNSLITLLSSNFIDYDQINKITYKNDKNDKEIVVWTKQIPIPTKNLYDESRPFI